MRDDGGRLSIRVKVSGAWVMSKWKCVSIALPGRLERPAHHLDERSIAAIRQTLGRGLRIGWIQFDSQSLNQSVHVIEQRNNCDRVIDGRLVPANGGYPSDIAWYLPADFQP